MIERVNDEVQKRFGVQPTAFLGGRCNRHWLVERKAEQLVLRRWAVSFDSIVYEVRLLEQVAALGWSVAPVVAGPFEVDGAFWSLSPFIRGEPMATHDVADEQRVRGRFLAMLHRDTAQIRDIGQRKPWRRCEEILSDESLDCVLAENETKYPQEIGILRWHLDHARERVLGLPLQHRPGIIVHGDFTTWNLRFTAGHLSGILDFELAHYDHRIADFALSWRGKYDAVIHGYNEVTPLESEEWQFLTPMWWAFLIEGICHDLAKGGWMMAGLFGRYCGVRPLWEQMRESFSQPNGYNRHRACVEPYRPV